MMGVRNGNTKHAILPEPMEASNEILQSTVVEDRQDAPPTLVIPPMPEMDLEPEEEESIYRPPEVLESFDISHRRAIDEEDLEPEEGLT